MPPRRIAHEIVFKKGKNAYYLQRLAQAEGPKYMLKLGGKPGGTPLRSGVPERMRRVLESRGISLAKEGEAASTERVGHKFFPIAELGPEAHKQATVVERRGGITSVGVDVGEHFAEWLEYLHNTNELAEGVDGMFQSWRGIQVGKRRWAITQKNRTQICRSILLSLERRISGKPEREVFYGENVGEFAPPEIEKVVLSAMSRLSGKEIDAVVTMLNEDPLAELLRRKHGIGKFRVSVVRKLLRGRL